MGRCLVSMTNSDVINWFLYTSLEWLWKDLLVLVYECLYETKCEGPCRQTYHLIRLFVTGNYYIEVLVYFAKTMREGEKRNK